MAHVLVPLAQGCEDLEAVTIVDLLRRADIKVTSASLDGEHVTGSRGTVFVADAKLDDVLDENFDLIALPGGLPGADNLNNDQRIHSILQKMQQKQGYIAAICAAPKVLEKAGLLDQKTATSFPGVLKDLNNPNINISNNKVEIDGNIITSKGPGTAIDFALNLIGLLAGVDKQKKVEAQMVRD